MECKKTLFTLYGATCRGNAKNSLYPNKYRITGLEEFLKMSDRDFVCAEYKDGRRSLSNFIGSDCICMDCDNTHSDNPSEWKTPEDVANTFPDVPFIVHFSRNNMKEKNGKSPRPKFHILFPTSYTTDPDEYQQRKQLILRHFPFFDSNATDNARFFFGTENPQAQEFNGSVNVEDIQYTEDEEEPDNEDYPDISNSVFEGRRNSSMHKRAVQIINWN